MTGQDTLELAMDKKLAEAIRQLRGIMDEHSRRLGAVEDRLDGVEESSPEAADKPKFYSVYLGSPFKVKLNLNSFKLKDLAEAWKQYADQDPNRLYPEAFGFLSRLKLLETNDNSIPAKKINRWQYFDTVYFLELAGVEFKKCGGAKKK